MRVVFVGNPGTGKSFILNALIGQVRFRSGVSLGSGLTLESSSFRDAHTGVTYVDTPGLDDVDHCSAAAHEISAALSEPGPTKLVFVATLETGRVRPADVTTVKLVLDAVERSSGGGSGSTGGMCAAGRFAIAVNKVSEPEMARLVAEPHARDAVTLAFSQARPTSHVAYFPLLRAAAGADDMLPCAADAAAYRAFVDAAPVVHLVAPPVVRAHAFAEDRLALETQMAATREAIERARETPAVQGMLENVNLPQNVDRLLGLFFGARADLGPDQRRALMRSFLEIVGLPLLHRLLGRVGAGAGAGAGGGERRGGERRGGDDPGDEARNHAVD